MVCPRTASQPTSGQPAISRLATKPIMRWLCSITMSIQLTWLATNSTGLGSGMPTRRTRRPKMRSSQVDHQHTMRSPNDSTPARPGDSAVHATSNGNDSDTCNASSGMR